MLNDLKRYINRDNEFTSALEAAAYVVIENSSDDIKSAFLDNPEMRMVGVENDPEIKKLVDAIPPVEGDVSNLDVAKMIEEFIPGEEGDIMIESFDDIMFESFEDDDSVLESDFDIDFDSTFDPEVEDIDMDDRDDLSDAEDNIIENFIIDEFDDFE